MSGVPVEILTERVRVHVANGRNVGWTFCSNFYHVFPERVRRREYRVVLRRSRHERQSDTLRSAYEIAID